MTYQTGKHPGATWRLCDFQIHTPRDNDWSGSPQLEGGDENAEDRRHEWADEFVSECLEREIGAIAITDHHDATMIEYVTAAISRSDLAKAKLWLFPGMEITCDDSVQCIILFDQGTDPEVVNLLFGVMPNIVKPDSATKSAPQAIPCGNDLSHLLNAVSNDSQLSVKSIVLPHASDDGYKTVIRKGFHSRFAELEVDGFYIEKDLAKSNPKKIDLVYGKSKEWGTRRRGIVSTGDNRNSSYSQLAKNPCWIRLGEPTAEAIRQAVLADQARIAYAPPSMPAQRVLELRVSSTLTGEDFEVSFNDGFNALIGGRGSGKSTILEYLRFGLGRSSPETSVEKHTEREATLLDDTLRDGLVEVDLERDGVKETWTRSLDQKNTIVVTAPYNQNSEEPTRISTADAQERYRARAFSQKQLSTIIQDKETVDEQITGIAAAEFIDARKKIVNEIDDSANRIVDATLQEIKKWTKTAGIEREKNKIDDQRQRLAATKDRLDKAGLSDDQRKTLEDAPKYERAESGFNSLKQQLTERLEIVSEFSNLAVKEWEDSFEFAPIKSTQDALQKYNLDFQSIIQGLKSSTELVVDKVSENLTQFEKERSDFGQRFEKAKTLQGHLANALNDYQRLSSELTISKATKDHEETDLEKLGNTTQHLEHCRSDIETKVQSLRSILHRAATKVQEMSEGRLTAKVVEDTKPKRLIDALVDLCSNCGVRDLNLHCTDRVIEAVGQNRKIWEEMIVKFTSARRICIVASDNEGIHSEAIVKIKEALGWKVTEGQASAILSRLDDHRLARLLSAWSMPYIRFEYKDQGVYMPFEKASPGQQAAALLTLMLSQEAGTLIIDQPEDDLDNRVIMDIVQQIQKTKHQRQLIFATHNPNFVVNGDADKVISLVPNDDQSANSQGDSKRIDIDQDGAIETPLVREAITKTMEGGKVAFELRGRKYALSSV